MIIPGSYDLYGQGQLQDSEITDVVVTELALNNTVPAHLIDVETNEGIVTLSGSVTNLLAKDRAVKVAQMVKGVRAVIDEIEIDVPVPENSILENRVSDALFDDPATESYEIRVHANNGIVTLEGTVDSWQEKQIAEYVAKGVWGIKGINNNIDIVYKSDRSDYQIEQDIKQALRYNLRIDDALVKVEVDDGEVDLSGSVGSAAEKQAAIADAWVSGVKSVNSSDLLVADWARNENLRKDKYLTKTDEELEEAVNDALLYDPRVLAFNPSVSVNGGYVTLRGTVNNLQAKRSAENTARNVVGVMGVNNLLKVRPASIPENSVLETEITEKLENNPIIDKRDIIVTAINGVVYLNGSVNTPFEKTQAESIASTTKGVVQVKNNLEVQSPAIGHTYYYGWNSIYPPMYDVNIVPLQSDSEIEKNIEDQLFWSPYVNEDNVEVTVVDGLAILKGNVETVQERKYAEINAYKGGAVEVQNDLIVQY